MTRHLRQLDIIAPAALAFPLHIVGCGAVGSWTALTLAKLGASRLVLWDHDVVEEHNVATQLYSPADVGQPKVYALRRLIERLSGQKAEAHERRFEDQAEDGGVILAVDSMDARISIWRRLRSKAIDYLIDSRMGAEVARIFTVRLASAISQQWYAATLYSSSEALQERCTARATAYCATGLAGFLAAKVAKLATGRRFSRELTIDFHNGMTIAPADG